MGGPPVTRRTLAAAALAAGAACAAAVAVPAAGSEPVPAIEASDTPAPFHAWSPASVSIAPGGKVRLANPGTIPHGIHWSGGPAVPACDPSVPVGSGFAASGTAWSGSCTFTAAGEYLFYCTVHGPAMAGRVIVGDASTPPPTTPAPTTPAPGSGAVAPPPPPAAGGAQEGSGGPIGALAVASSPRRGVLTGSLTVEGAGAGGRLVIELSAWIPATGGRRAHEVTLARLTHPSVTAGLVRFSLPLGAAGRRLLHGRGTLGVTLSARLLVGARLLTSRSRGLTLTLRALR